MTVGDALLLAAGTMALWVPLVQMACVGIVITALHLYASLMGFD